MVSTVTTALSLFRSLQHGKICPLNDDINLKDTAVLSFDVANAHCYDPNEQAKIRGVIAASACDAVTVADELNAKIHQLAESLARERMLAKAAGISKIGLILGLEIVVYQENIICSSLS